MTTFLVVAVVLLSLLCCYLTYQVCKLKIGVRWLAENGGKDAAVTDNQLLLLRERVDLLEESLTFKRRQAER